MADQEIRSRPTYQPIARDQAGRRHLLLVETDAVPPAALAPGTTAADFDERWTIAGHSRAIPGTGDTPCDHAFRARQHMLIALRRRLGREHMGLRLYAIGREPFLWAVNGVAAKFGLGREEIRLHADGSGARRVFCNHCRTITDQVTTNIVACSGCNAHLFVRDHFSRRLNAFAGVQVDAEVPGEIPAIETLYP